MSSRKKPSIKVNVKLSTGADKSPSVASLEKTRGVLNVTQTFPGETDHDLANLFLLEVKPGDIDSALDQIRAMPDVEYVEEAAPRKLMGGKFKKS